MSGIDWSKAPEGTTGAMVAQFGNSSIREGAVEFVPRGSWQRSDYEEGPDAWVYIEKPTTWAGEGLPPVGTVCELTFAHWSGWEECTVLCIGEKMIFVRQLTRAGKVYEGSMNREGVKFRPSRTQEQIEREARSKACSDISKIVEPYNTSIDCSAAIRATVEAMIDAGYRK